MSDFNRELETCQFLPFSQVAQGLPPLESWLFGDDAPFSYGDNNRTLVKVSRVVDYILDKDLDTPNLLERLKTLPDDLYLDLEN